MTVLRTERDNAMSDSTGVSLILDNVRNQMDAMNVKYDTMYLDHSTMSNRLTTLLSEMKSMKEKETEYNILKKTMNNTNIELTGKYSSEGAAREWSTVVDISIPPPSFKLVSLSSPRSPLSKTPKHVIF